MKILCSKSCFAAFMVIIISALSINNQHTIREGAEKGSNWCCSLMQHNLSVFLLIIRERARRRSYRNWLCMKKCAIKIVTLISESFMQLGRYLLRWYCSDIVTDCIALVRLKSKSAVLTSIIRRTTKVIWITIEGDSNQQWWISFK